MAWIGMPYFSASDTRTPPRAVPTSLVITIPVTPTISRKISAWAWAFWPVVASTTRSTDVRASEGVAGGEHHLVAGIAVLLGELGDRRGLAAAVDPDDENDKGPLGEIETQRLHDRLDEPDHLFGQCGANFFGGNLLVEAG